MSVYVLYLYKLYRAPEYSVTTSQRCPFTEQSFSNADITSRCALPTSAEDIPGFDAPLTLAETSSMPSSTTNSTPGHLGSSARGAPSNTALISPFPPVFK